MLGLTQTNSNNLKSQKQQPSQPVFKADPNGYLLRLMTSENGQSINPPERLAPIVRTDPKFNRMRAEKMEVLSDLLTVV